MIFSALSAAFLVSVPMLNEDLPSSLGTIGKTACPVVPGDTLVSTAFLDSSGRSTVWRPGRTTLFVVVGYWCDTWKAQLPRVQNVRKRLRQSNIDVKVVSIDGRWTELGKNRGFPPDFVDHRSRWSAALGLDRVPYSFVVNQKGTVKWSKFGVTRTDEMVDAAVQADDRDARSSTISLTFDDFPSPGDEDLLDLLAREEIRATFFVIGEKLSAYPDLVNRAVREGHQIEIHGWKHDPKRVDAPLVAKTLRKDFGIEPSYIRHPGSEAIFTLDGKRVQARTTNPYDYSRPGSNEIVRRTLNHVRKDGIILFHSGVDQTLIALPKIIRNLRRLNYRFSLLRRATGS